MVEIPSFLEHFLLKHVCLPASAENPADKELHVQTIKISRNLICCLEWSQTSLFLTWTDFHRFCSAFLHIIKTNILFIKNELQVQAPMDSFKTFTDLFLLCEIFSIKGKNRLLASGSGPAGPLRKKRIS